MLVFPGGFLVLVLGKGTVPQPEVSIRRKTPVACSQPQVSIEPVGSVLIILHFEIGIANIVMAGAVFFRIGEGSALSDELLPDIYCIVELIASVQTFRYPVRFLCQ